MSTLTFSFVKIPADVNSPIEVLTETTAGGLSDDALIRYAKTFFAQELNNLRSSSNDTLQFAKKLQEASSNPDDRRVLATRFRQQLLQEADNGHKADLPNSSSFKKRVETMNDDEILEFVQNVSTQQSQASCDIIALTVPTPNNGHTAVSMYVSDHGVELNLPLNTRAAQIVAACGHNAASSAVHGTAFVGRAIDNEAADVWQRVEFGLADVDPTAEWCRTARQPGGGGGTGNRTGAASLNRLVHSSNPQVITNQATTANDSSLLFGSEGAPVQESWGSWTQNEQEVELSFKVPSDVKAKNCSVNFKRNYIKIEVNGSVLLQGKTFDPIEVDESTFTLHDEGLSGRMLIVTLGKLNEHTWSWVVSE